ncbi:MAG: hypothetical protein MUF54_01845 [Polyangiaceae bacterium]|jgi:hypothetical protein|nr:hypothetical protein [Polyangiaceae bacterium]
MKEIEIRAILARLCEELDARRARVASAVVVGGSLVLASGCGTESVIPNPTDDAGIAEASTDAGADAHDAGPGDAAVDQGPLPPYMAPDSGPTPEYMAVDSGPTPDYMAVDAGPTPDYMAVDAADDGPTPVYMSACAPADDKDPVV